MEFLLGLREAEELVEALGENGDAEKRPTRGIGGLSVSNAVRRGVGADILACRWRRAPEGGWWCRDVVMSFFVIVSRRGCCVTRRVE